MKKKLILCAFTGALLGFFISYIITIIISLFTGNGDYYPASHELMEACGSPIAAVIVQLFGSMAYGAIWGMAALIWSKEDWSFLRMTTAHFFVCCILTLPIAWLLGWIPTYTILGTVLYFAIFFGVYLMIWLIYYLSMKSRIEKINRKMSQGY